MDISRLDFHHRKLRRNVARGFVLAALLGAAAVFVLRLEPVILTVDATLWTDTFRRGPLLRHYRPGKLIARGNAIRLVSAQIEAEVLRIGILSGLHKLCERLLVIFGACRSVAPRFEAESFVVHTLCSPNLEMPCTL